MKWVLYGIAFLVEIAAWCAIAGVAFLLVDGWPAWLLAVVIFALVVTLWGIFMAPRARHPLPAVAYYLVKGVLYVIAGVLIWRWNVGAGIAFVVAVAISEPALALRRREEFTGADGDPGASPG